MQPHVSACGFAVIPSLGFFCDSCLWRWRSERVTELQDHKTCVQEASLVVWSRWLARLMLAALVGYTITAGFMMDNR